MVCVVKDCASGQIIPSCTTLPTEGMNIDTESEEVMTVRTLSLELLLSDHRADCEAPCSMVCTQGLDIEQMLNLYDTGKYKEAYTLISTTFAMPTTECDSCKAPCEKVCRRGTVDQAVSIRAVIKEVIDLSGTNLTAAKKVEKKADRQLYQSRLGRFTTREKELLKESVATPSGCLHCACTGREDCKLRLYATAAGIKRSRYGASSALQAVKKQRITGNMWFEQAKCIRCGLCVYNSKNGFTFKDRGFGMQVVMPDENRKNACEELTALCPTGAFIIAKTKCTDF
jgi:predicted molibdopterin-dependent oxidoreductase YjgC